MPQPSDSMTREELDAHWATTVSERVFLQHIVQAAQERGWLCHHTLETRVHAKVIGPGFPDLVMVRDNRLIFAELKSAKGKLSHDQEMWLHALGLLHRVHGCAVYTWRPYEWDRILEILT